MSVSPGLAVLLPLSASSWTANARAQRCQTIAAEAVVEQEVPGSRGVHGSIVYGAPARVRCQRPSRYVGPVLPLSASGRAKTCCRSAALGIWPAFRFALRCFLSASIKVFGSRLPRAQAQALCVDVACCRRSYEQQQPAQANMQCDYGQRNTMGIREVGRRG